MKNSAGSRSGSISFRWFPDLKLFWNRCKEIWPDTACFPGTCGQNSKIKIWCFWYISDVASGRDIFKRNQTKSFLLYGSGNLNYRTLWLIRLRSISRTKIICRIGWFDSWFQLAMNKLQVRKSSSVSMKNRLEPHKWNRSKEKKSEALKSLL